MNQFSSVAAVLSDADRRQVKEQLERLLSNPHFNQSRRFPSFLRFVVDHALVGSHERLKERTLGIEIFGREADYDTSSDPIVRVTATEIRKRIAQYYQEPGHESELRISLPAGSYIPHFEWPPISRQTATAPAEPLVLVPVAAPVALPAVDPTLKATRERIAASNPRRWFRRPAFLLLLIPLVLVCAGAALLWRSSRPTPFDFFWGPLVNTNEPVLFCLADQRQYPIVVLRDAADPSHETMLKDNLTAIIIDDLNPVVLIASQLQLRAKKFTLKGEGVTGLGDLRNGPTVFIGAFDNAWTLRLTGALRYHFANDPKMTEFRIVDSKQPASPGWAIDRQQQFATNTYRDFAIVARFTDSTTGKIAIVAAGVGRGGTRIAGEYVTDTADLAQLERLAIRAGNKKNMEVVLSTQIIDGEPGSPKVEASYFW